MNFAEAVREIESFGMMPDRPPSLEPTRRALEGLGLLERVDPERVVVVAGTNGKGTTSATLEALLLSACQRVGLYTSPHLETIRERFRVGGEMISETAFLETYLMVRGACLDHRLTHFEVLTVMAAQYFVDLNLDRMILEVGLGGLWDATNAVPHANAVITTLGLDHENLLGAAISEIARNKLGIVTPGARVAHAPFPPEARGVAERTRSECGGTWREREPFGYQPLHGLRTRWGEARLSLPGRRSAENAALAMTAFEMLGFDPAKHLQALAKVDWPGRMERVSLSGLPCDAYLSGDHNPQGIESLFELLPHYPRNHLHVLVGVGKDKDEEKILAPLFSLPDASVYLTVTPFRGKALDEYSSKWLKRARGNWADPAEAIAAIASSHAREGDLLLVTGSLYLVGKIRALSSRDSAAKVAKDKSIRQPPRT